MSNTTVSSSPVDMERETARLINIIAQFAICACLIPMQIMCLYILLKGKEFRNNASLQLVVRLIVLDFFQTAALLVTGFYHVYPKLVEFEPLRKPCSVILISFFLGKVPLQFELTMFRILVVAKRSDHEELPRAIKGFEALVWIGVVIVSVAAWMTNAFIYMDGTWYYNEEHWIPRILANAELFFCLPICTVTYLLYTALIIMIFWSGAKFLKDEWSLFLQCTTMFLTETIGIAIYHAPEVFERPDIYESVWYPLFNTYNWTIAFGWTSLFLLTCNRRVRSRIWWKPTTTTVSLVRTNSSY